MKCRTLICAVLFGVFALAGEWPQRTAVVADAQGKKEPSKPGKDAEAGPEKDKKGHYVKVEIVGVLCKVVTRPDPNNEYHTVKVWAVLTGKTHFYLDFEGKEDLLKAAAQESGRAVFIAGSLEFRYTRPVMSPFVKVATLRREKKD